MESAPMAANISIFGLLLILTVCGVLIFVARRYLARRKGRALHGNGWPGRERIRDDARDRVRVKRQFHSGAETRFCPDCGNALPSDAPEGLCPRCLLHSGLGSNFPSPLESDEHTRAYRGPFVPPMASDL